MLHYEYVAFIVDNPPVLVPCRRHEEGLRALLEVPPALALLPAHPLGLHVVGHPRRVW